MELKKFWERSNIPIQHDWWIKKSILGLNSKYLDILNHLKRETSTEIRKRSNFQSSLQKLFDIASPVAEQELQKDRVLGKKKAQEDSMFLESQRTDRVAKMVGQDKKYESSKLKSIQRKNKEANFLSKQSTKSEVLSEVVKDTVSEDVEDKNNNEEDFEAPRKKVKSDTVTLEIPRNLFKSPAVAAMLDRTQISSRKAVGFAASLLKTAGADLTEFNLSHSTLQRQRDISREVLAMEALDDLKNTKPEHLVIHWDSKLIDDAHGTKHERLSILASGAPNYVEGKLLGVPSLRDEDGNPTSSGYAQFKGASDFVRIWDIKNSVRGFVFDTTASNSGVRQGACKSMEEWLERPVLWLACRHHLAEIMAKECWYELYEDDLGPDNLHFVEFKSLWPNLNTDSDVPTKRLNISNRHLRKLKDEAIEFYEDILTNPNSNGALPRDNYREIAETSLIILGGELPNQRKIFWHKPGATHKARFMAFGIYANKMFSFSDQIQYDREMREVLQRFTQFFTLI